MKLNKVAVVSKFGSKEAEEAGKNVAKKFLSKKIEVFTIAPVSVIGAKKVESIEELKNKKLDLVITIGGDGTTLRTFRHLQDETAWSGNDYSIHLLFYSIILKFDFNFSSLCKIFSVNVNFI